MQMRTTVGIIFVSAMICTSSSIACSLSQPSIAMADEKDREIIAKVESALFAPMASQFSVQTNLAERMFQLKIPGVSVAVVRDGQLAWAAAWGFSDISTCKPLSVDTRLQAASISKPIAAVAMLAAAEKNKLSLDEPIKGLANGWTVPLVKDIKQAPTLRQLLSHTGGTTVHGFAGYELGKPVPSVLQILKAESPTNSEAIVVDTAPGSAFRYSGGGYVLAQQWLSEKTAKSFTSLVQSHVFKPAAMAASGYVLPANHASAHEQGSVIEGGYHIYPELAAASVWTTPSDLARFAIAMQRAHDGSKKSMLNQKTAEIALTPVMNNYGVGFVVEQGNDGVRFGHDGVNAGFESKMIAGLSNGRAIVVMTNAQGGQRLAQELITTIATAEGWRDLSTKRVEEVALSDSQREAVTGYFAGPGFRVGITEMQGRLRLNANGEEVSELLPVAQDKLLVAGMGLTLKTFRDNSGRITALEVIDGPPLRLERTADPLSSIGSVPIFLRGTMNNWSVSTPLTQESHSWAVDVELNAGTYMFKLASEDWASVDLGAVGGTGIIKPDTEVVLAAGGANINLAIPEKGRWRFVLDVSDRKMPRVKVMRLD